MKGHYLVVMLLTLSPHVIAPRGGYFGASYRRMGLNTM